MSAVVTEEEIHYCTVHTNVEATLRCNKCNRWMCVKCAVQTPVGYRCRECIRGLEEKFFTATSTDYAVAFGACAVLGLVGGLLMSQIGFLYLALILAIPAGGLISEVARRLTSKRRGRYMAYVSAAGVAVGALAPMGYVLLRAGTLIPNIGLLLFAVLAAGTVYGRFAMWK